MTALCPFPFMEDKSEVPPVPWFRERCSCAFYVGWSALLIGEVERELCVLFGESGVVYLRTLMSMLVQQMSFHLQLAKSED